MRTSRLVASTLFVTLGALAVASVRSTVQEPIQPTEHHRGILKGVGEWEGTLTAYMPGAPAEPVAAREVVVPVGEFWTQSRFECDFMGMPYIGTGCVGYDVAKKKFVGTWIDSMSTSIAMMEGERDAETGALVMRWEAPDGMSGELVPHRSVTVETGDSYTSTFYMGEGEGVKSMTIEMRRSSKKALEAGAGK